MKTTVRFIKSVSKQASPHLPLTMVSTAERTINLQVPGRGVMPFQINP